MLRKLTAHSIFTASMSVHLGSALETASAFSCKAQAFAVLPSQDSIIFCSAVVPSQDAAFFRSAVGAGLAKHGLVPQLQDVLRLEPCLERLQQRRKEGFEGWANQERLVADMDDSSKRNGEGALAVTEPWFFCFSSSGKSGESLLSVT